MKRLVYGSLIIIILSICNVASAITVPKLVIHNQTGTAITINWMGLKPTQFHNSNSMINVKHANKHTLRLVRNYNKEVNGEIEICQKRVCNWVMVQTQGDGSILFEPSETPLNISPKKVIWRPGLYDVEFTVK